MNDIPPFETLKLATRFRVPDYMPGIFAHHLLVQPIEHEIILTFFQLQMPLIGGTPDEVESQIASIKEHGFVDANCVAKIIVSKEKLPSFVKAMNDFVQAMQAEVKDHGE